MGLEGQQFDEQGRLATRPAALLYSLTARRDAERAEQMNL